MTNQVVLPVAGGVTIETTTDGKQTGIFFKTSGEPGFVGVTLATAELSRLVSLLISQAAKVATQTTPEHPPEKLTATPILASHLGA